MPQQLMTALCKHGINPVMLPEQSSFSGEHKPHRTVTTLTSECNEQSSEYLLQSSSLQSLISAVRSPL